MPTTPPPPPPPPPPKAQAATRHGFLGLLGKFLMSVGAGVALFLAWSLWGTTVVAQQDQEELAVTFDRMPASYRVMPEEEPELLPPEDFAPGPGKPVFRLRIPSIGVDDIVVEGVGPEELKKGPGHYPTCRKGFDPALCTEWDSPFPGEDGRVVVSGHRTTYGAPFWDLDKLGRGDRILTDTKWGSFTYEVVRTRIVDPSSRQIVVPGERAEIVLTTCNPRFSAAQRLIVIAKLVESSPAAA